MQVTITITDKLIKSAISNALDNEVYENWNTATIKAAKIPKISAVTTEIFQDPKFQAQLVKELQETAESAVEDFIYEAMDEINIPQITELCKRVEQAEEAMDAVEQEKREAEEVARMLKTLERAGYKIKKA